MEDFQFLFCPRSKLSSRINLPLTLILSLRGEETGVEDFSGFIHSISLTPAGHTLQIILPL